MKNILDVINKEKGIQMIIYDDKYDKETFSWIDNNDIGEFVNPKENESFDEYLKRIEMIFFNNEFSKKYIIDINRVFDIYSSDISESDSPMSLLHARLVSIRHKLSNTIILLNKVFKCDSEKYKYVSYNKNYKGGVSTIYLCNTILKISEEDEKCTFRIIKSHDHNLKDINVEILDNV